MTLPLVASELVKAVETLIPFPVTVVGKARALWGFMLPAMAGEVAGAGKGGSAALPIASKAIGSDVGTARSCGNAAGGKTHFGEVSVGLLGVSVCRAIHFRSSSGESCGVAGAIRAVKVIAAAEFRGLEGYARQLVGDKIGIREIIVIETHRQDGGASGMTSICRNVTGTLRNRLVSRVQRGRAESGINLAAIGCNCILLLEVEIVEGVGVN
jgi:hypothetical protein